MRRRALAIALLVLVAGCGGGGGGSADEPQTFSDSGFGITFEYPGNFELRDDVNVGATAGGAAKERRAVTLDGDNMILISKYELRTAIDESNVDQVKSEADRVFTQLAGTSLSGDRVTVGGLPGYEYNFDVADPENGRSRVTMLFDGRAQYNLNCQSTPAKRDELDRACRRALETLERK